MTQDGDNVIPSDGPVARGRQPRGVDGGLPTPPRDASRLARPLPTAARDRDGSVQLGRSKLHAMGQSLRAVGTFQTARHGARSPTTAP